MLIEAPDQTWKRQRRLEYHAFYRVSMVCYSFMLLILHCFPKISIPSPSLISRTMQSLTLAAHAHCPRDRLAAACIHKMTDVRSCLISTAIHLYQQPRTCSPRAQLIGYRPLPYCVLRPMSLFWLYMLPVLMGG